ncbi:hypothetical protein [Sphingosinithalassobacter portus]|uniref:hypothetical protein n=1 Tax=Stakelama portus TaxID=2676234 RepID=UPI0011AB8946|nr:hypothetical protein [Sphingosinithalassobacter portus]
MRSLICSSVSMAAAAAMLHAAPALAQDKPLWSDTGTIVEDSWVDADGHHFADKEVVLQEGVRYRVSATSGDIDTVLTVFAPRSEEVVETNDDGPDGTDSVLTFMASRTGPYRLRVASYEPEQFGDYMLSIATAAPPAPPQPFTGRSETVVWTVHEGTLDDSGEGDASADFLIHLEAGKDVSIGAKSDDFDVVLSLFSAQDRFGEPVAGDDDSGGGTNAMLTFTPEETGDYIIRVGSYEGSGTGAYTVSVQK